MQEEYEEKVVIIRIWIIASQSERSEVGVFGNRATDYGRHHHSDLHQWEAERLGHLS